MRKPELEFHEPLVGWPKLTGDGEHGIWDQILAADPLSGDSTLLQRYEPGAATIGGGVIVHDYWEEVMILSGELTDVTLGKTFTPGMYACRPPGMRHGPYVSSAGCSMLVIVRPSPEPGANGRLAP